MQTKAEIIGMAKRTQIKVDPENEQNTGIVGVKLLKGLFWKNYGICKKVRSNCCLGIL